MGERERKGERERERETERESERERERESAVRTYAPSCYFNISLCHSVIRTYNIFSHVPSGLQYISFIICLR